MTEPQLRARIEELERDIKSARDSRMEVLAERTALEAQLAEARSEIKRLEFFEGASANSATAELRAQLAAAREVIEDGLRGVPRDPEGRVSDGWWMGHTWGLQADALLAAGKDAKPEAT